MCSTLQSEQGTRFLGKLNRNNVPGNAMTLDAVLNLFSLGYCSLEDRSLAERLFFTGMGSAMLAARGVSRSRTAVRAARAAVDAADFEPTDIQEWALREFKSTSPWAVGQALSALGRHHSRPWLGRIDVPTAVVVLNNDHVIPPARQRSQR